MRTILIWRGVLHLVLARQFLRLAVRLDGLTGLALDAAEVQRNRSCALAERLGPAPIPASADRPRRMRCL